MHVTVCVSDLQIPYHDKRAVETLIKFIKSTRPDEVATVGDEMDMQTLSRWSRGTQLEFEGSLGRDRDETVRILERLKVTHMTRSNHIDRLFNTVAMRAPGFTDLPELNIQNFLRLDDLGIEYHESPYELAPGWLLMHGDEGRANSNSGMTALGLARRTNMSVVCGHTHRGGLVPYTTGYTGGKPKTIWGLETGNLMDYKKAKYIKAGMMQWQQGFGILYTEGKVVTPSFIPVQRDGSFVVGGRKWE